MKTTLHCQRKTIKKGIVSVINNCHLSNRLLLIHKSFDTVEKKRFFCFILTTF